MKCTKVCKSSGHCVTVVAQAAVIASAFDVILIEHNGFLMDVAPATEKRSRV